MTSSISLKDWLNAVVEASSETAAQPLGLQSVTEAVALNPDQKIPESSWGSFLPLHSDDESVQIGLVTDRSGFVILSQAMLQMTPDHPDLTADDISDAVGEIVNVIAGGVKRRLSGKAKITLGLPLFVKGSIEWGAELEAGVADLHMGPVPVRVVVLRRKPS